MNATDSRQDSGPGILILQDHTGIGRAGGSGLEERHAIFAERKIGRDDKSIGDIGHIRHQRGSVGDLIGGFLWKESTRAMPAWSFVMPSKTLSGTVDSETVTSAGATGPSGSSGKDGPGGFGGDKSQQQKAGAVGPNTESTKNSKNAEPGWAPTPKSEGGGVWEVGVIPGGTVGLPGFAISGGPVGNVTGNVGLFGVFDSPPNISNPNAKSSLPGGTQNPNSKFNTKTGATGPTKKKQQGDDVKAWIGGYADFIVNPVVRPTNNTSWATDFRFRSIQPTQPRGWPQLPNDWHGLTLPATNEDEQIEYFHPTDPRLPLVHNGGEAKCGAVACDLDGQNQPDLDRHARLHTMLRILKAPFGARNVLAWNLTNTGRGDSRGGYVIDHATGSDQKQNQRGRGPTSGTPVSGGLRPGGIRGRQGKVTRLVVALASHNDGGFMHPGLPNDPHQISNDGDGNPVNPLHFDIENGLFINPSNESEDGPLDLIRRFRTGADLDYPTQVNFAFNQFKRKFGWWTTNVEEYIPWEPPDHPDEPPTIKPPRKRGPTSGGKQAATGGGGGGGGGGSGDGNGAGLVQLTSSRAISRVGYTRRWIETQIASMSYRAPIWGAGAPNMIHDRQPAARARLDRLSPTVIRSETFGKQYMLGATFTGYTQPPGASRYEGGTINGGEWLLPPEVGGEDYAAGFAPTDRAISSSVFGMGPGVSLGFGLPDLPTGGVRSGHALRDVSGDLTLYGFDSVGLGTEVMRFESGGGIRFPMISAPSAPAAAHVVLYALGDRLYTKTENNIPRSLDLKTTAATFTASTTQSQGQGQLTSDFSYVDAVVNANDTVTLPQIETGREVIIENAGAETLQVFPSSGASVDGGGTDASTTIASGVSARFIARNATNWRTV